MQPWLGDKENEIRQGFFGLYESCKYENFLIDEKQTLYGLESYFTTTTTPKVHFRVNPAATFFVGISVLSSLLCIGFFLVLFLFVNPTIVFTLCGVLQSISSKFDYIIPLCYRIYILSN